MADRIRIPPAQGRRRIAREWASYRELAVTPDAGTVVNLFALRATNPGALYADPADACGSENDEAIRAARASADIVVCAWGAHGALWSRGDHVRGLAGLAARHLGLTKGGQPRHPLYVLGTTEPQPWREGR